MAFQGDSIFWVEVEKVVPNPFQPRREFDEAKLKELSESVRMYGILQPLTVTRREIQNEDGSFRSEYELIAGERRLRASKLAGLAQVPVIIREGEQSEQEKLELAIIENLQREDLNAVDRALAFRQLADVFGLSHTQVAHKVGRSREYVSNTIRLLALPDYMLNSLRTGDMSEGHARTLLMLNDRPEEQDTVFREILLKKLSVREVERIARGIASEKIRKKNDYDADLVELEKKFTETLGTRVSIVKTEFGGRLSIDYFTQEDLEGMLTRMRTEQTMSPLGAFVTPIADDIIPYMEPGELANPRADDLLVLTNSIGLELVPAEVVATAEAPVELTEEAAPTNYGAMVAETITQSEAVPEPTPVAPSPDQLAETFAETGPMQRYGGGQVDSVTDVSEETLGEYVSAETGPMHGESREEISVAPVVSAEVTPLVTESEALPVVNSFVSLPVVSPAAPEAVSRPSLLREQLAALLGHAQSVPSAAAAALPVASVQPFVSTPTLDLVPAAPQPPVAPPEPDDSALYDLKNFSV